MSAFIAEFKKIAVVNTLRSCQLFTGLPLPDWQNIADVTVLKSLEKDDYLFHEGDPAHGFYVVQRGAVNVHRVNAAGKEQIIHVFRTGESFAEVALASATGYPADARALEPTQVLLVQKDGILALLKRQPELALRMLGSMSSHLRVLVAQLEDLTLKDVETRLANWLVKRCPEPAEQSAGKNRTGHDQASARRRTGHGERNFFAHAGEIPETVARQSERQNRSRFCRRSGWRICWSKISADDCRRCYATCRIMFSPPNGFGARSVHSGSSRHSPSTRKR